MLDFRGGPWLFLSSSVVEQAAVNRRVGGSNPSSGARPVARNERRERNRSRTTSRAESRGFFEDSRYRVRRGARNGYGESQDALCLSDVGQRASRSTCGSRKGAAYHRPNSLTPWRFLT